MEAARTVRVLLVDDSPLTSMERRKRLEADGFSVLVAADANEALARVKASPPTIVFLHLTSGASASFVQQLKADLNSRHIRVELYDSYYREGRAQPGLRPVARGGW